jgi:hypothetical protein
LRRGGRMRRQSGGDGDGGAGLEKCAAGRHTSGYRVQGTGCRQ